jgi:hypothetical protein
MLHRRGGRGGIGTVRLDAGWTPASRGRTLLPRLAGAVLGDPQLIVDTRCAHGAREQVGAAAIGGGSDDAGQRHLAVVDLDVDDGAAPARRDGKRPVLFDAIQDQVLQFVVVQHPGLGAADGFSSYHRTILWEDGIKLLSILQTGAAVGNRVPGQDRVRVALLAVLLLGLVGSLVELLLIGHDEDTQQLIPVGLIAAGLLVVPWNLLRPSPGSIRVLQALMLLFVAAGLLGVYYHFDANREFQLEMDPTLSGTGLLWTVLQAKSPPTLSPGLMVQFGLLGLIFAWGHPLLIRSSRGVRT